MKHTLFAYGTLKDPDIQKALFEKKPNMKKARVPGWSLQVASDGYLFIKPMLDRAVDGVLLELDKADLDRADLWEDVPTYRRERLSALTESDELVGVWAYTRRYATGDPYPEDGIGPHNKDVVIREIHEMLTQL
jgi:gamma-glutamylcyclotransferase (GGCT)/AIG2-like uncharacterized protein YtfP